LRWLEIATFDFPYKNEIKVEKLFLCKEIEFELFSKNPHSLESPA
jgi:hypothetical protein